MRVIWICGFWLLCGAVFLHLADAASEMDE
jgi:hypothetical protein